MKINSRDPSKYQRDGGLKRRLADLPAAMRWGALAATLVVAVFILWLGFQGLVAKSNLEQAQTAAHQAKDALLNSESAEATRFAESARSHAREAQVATHSLPWNIAAAVPFVGSPLKTTQQISDVVAGLADDVLVPGAKIGAGFSPSNLISGTRLNLKLLSDEAPQLSELAVAAAKLDISARSISNPAFVSLVRDARKQLQEQTSRLALLLKNTALAAQLAPSMLGAEGPRKYLMAFQTPAEARGTGGILGAFGIIDFNDGMPVIETLAENGSLRNSLASDDNAVAVVDLGSEFNNLYGWTNPYTDLRNSNMSAHFPYAAQIWKSMWENSMWARESGQTLDGVMAMDIVALSYILGALGPVAMPDGEVITQENVVELTGSTTYIRYPSEEDQPARKQYLQTIAREILKKATGEIQSPRKLLDALGRAASEGRISVWSTSPADQRLLEQTPLAHVIPDDPAPYLQVVVNNLAGNKMDYYLKREIEYIADGCDGDRRNSTITVRLANTAANLQLPDFHAGVKDFAPGIQIKTPIGSMVSSINVVATEGAKLLSVTSNGERTPAIRRIERGHPSFEVQVVIPPGQTGELTFRLSEPTSQGDPRVPVQPLIDNPTMDVSVPSCP